MAESVPAQLLHAAQIHRSACKALDAAPGIADTVIGFHAQQVCEKCFKAALVGGGIEAPRSHDLTRLMELLIGNGMAVPAAARWVDELTPYAVAARYGMVALGLLDRPRALLTVDLLCQWASSLLPPPASP